MLSLLIMLIYMPHTQLKPECATFLMAKSYGALIALFHFLLLQMSTEESASISFLGPYT
jgi:hypothetical protein